MIMIVTAQILRENSKNQEFCNEIIDASIDSIEKDFLKPEFKAVLETVGHQGEFFDHFDGRMLSKQPGLFLMNRFFETMIQDSND